MRRGPTKSVVMRSKVVPTWVEPTRALACFLCRLFAWQVTYFSIQIWIDSLSLNHIANLMILLRVFLSPKCPERTTLWQECKTSSLRCFGSIYCRMCLCGCSIARLYNTPSFIIQTIPRQTKIMSLWIWKSQLRTWGSLRQLLPPKENWGYLFVL